MIVEMAGKIFNKWEAESVSINDRGLQKYLNLDAPERHSFNLYTNKRFSKKKYNIIERLVKKMMVTGHLKDSRVHKKVSGRDTGKKQTAVKIVKKALEEIESKTSKNPVQILVRAVENTAPCEETTRIRHGGIIVHKAVDVAPQRRIDLSLSFISHGAAQRAFKSKTSISKGLASELIAASKNDNKIYSVGKKEESERVAASAR